MEKFFQAFGGSRKEKFWGAQPVPAASKTLKELADKGILRRVRLGLGGNWQPGFPKWVWSYTLEAGWKKLFEFESQKLQKSI